MGTFKESELERYLLLHPNELQAALFEQYNPDEPIKILGSQIRCPTGRIDMLAYWKRTLFVIELKARQATERTVGQVYRYVLPTRFYAERVAIDKLFDMFGMDALAYPNIEPLARAVVIAPTFTDEALRALSYDGYAICVRETEEGFELYRPSRWANLFEATELERALWPMADWMIGESYGRQIELTYRQLVQVASAAN